LQWDRQRVDVEPERKRPSGFGVQARRHGAEGADDGEDAEPERRLDTRVPLQSADSPPDDITVAGGPSEPRREAQQIDRGNHKHGAENPDLGEEQPAIFGSDQGRNGAGEKPGVDHATRE
jgi:hypothetical protein